LTILGAGWRAHALKGRGTVRTSQADDLWKESGEIRLLQERQNKALQERCDRLEATLSSTTATLASTISTLATMTNTVDAQAAEISTLKALVKTLESQITSLKGQLTRSRAREAK
jgi:cell division protein FtsB